MWLGEGSLGTTRDLSTASDFKIIHYRIVGNGSIGLHEIMYPYFRTETLRVSVSQMTLPPEMVPLTE